MRRLLCSPVVVVALTAALLPLTPAGSASATAPSLSHAGSVSPTTPERLTNLAHLDWLRTSVTPPAQPGHTTYRLASEPEVGVLWTYADRQPDGSYRRIGGGRHDPQTDTWGQGAYNADDVSRVAVAYLRHWRATGSPDSRAAAYHLLRGLAYLQTVDGPDAGNVVLWMQPDGTLNRSANPPDSPDPSDSADSYWLARTIWAYGEGYAAFRDADPDFADYLRARLHLAIGAVEREVLVHDGQWLHLDGLPVPGWLIADGADATGEALLGLAAYLSVRPDDSRARQVLARLADGVALMRAGDPDQWPYGAILPWGRSRAVWHAWGGLAPAGLARAYQVLGEDRLADAAVSDAASFTPHLLVAAGPENGWLPAPTDRVQISYGAESRVESLLAVAEATDRPGLATLAGIAAAWYFGANPAGQRMYDPTTGRTFDGVHGATVNRNSGAESAIHGVLAMLWLDANPDLIPVAATARVTDRRTWRLVEAESGTLSGSAEVHRPVSAWTGESLWSGGAGVRLGPGGQVRIPVEAAEPARLLPVVELAPDSGRTLWGNAGIVRHDAVGEQGDSPAPGLLAVRTLPGTVAPEAVTVSGLDRPALIDAVLVQPEVEWLTLGSDSDTGTALVRSFATAPRRAAVVVPGTGQASVEVYDASGRLVLAHESAQRSVSMVLPPGGFAVVRR